MKGFRPHGLNPEVVRLGSGVGTDDLLIHDEKADEPTLAYLLSRMVHDPGNDDSFPEVVGVLRAVERPVHHERWKSCRLCSCRFLLAGLSWSL